MVRLDELGTGHIDAAYDRLREPVPVPARPPRKPAAPSCGLPIRRDGTPRLRPGELRGQVVAHLRAHPGAVFAPHEVARALGRGRSCGAIRQRLAKLAAGGEVLQVSTRPCRYAYDPKYEGRVPAAPPARTRRLSAASIRRIHCTLRKALNDAVHMRILDYNPAIHAELEPAEPPRVRYWTHGEAGRFLDAIVDDPLYALYHLAAYRGLRRGELVALRWRDVDLDEGSVEVRKNIVQLGSQTVEGTPKSPESQRLIGLDPDTAAVLGSHRDRQQRASARLGLAWHEDGFVFAVPEGAAVKPEYVSRHFAMLVGLAGVPVITLHQLRHTAASLMQVSGVASGASFGGLREHRGPGVPGQRVAGGEGVVAGRHAA